MEEKNKKSLKKAIDNLPKYSPKDNLWDKLFDNMDEMQKDGTLHEAINELPTYTAPAGAWENIEKALPARRKKMWPQVLAIAATLALLVGYVSNYAVSNFEQEVVHISHQQKSVTETQFVQLHNMQSALRDSAFMRIIEAQKKESDEAKLILAELEKLDSSKKRLKSRLSKYDVNEQLEEKLDMIEKESIELQQAYLATI